MVEQIAYEIARNFDVTTKPDTLVLYSISFQNNDENKQQALVFIKNNPSYVTISDTPCGKALEELDLFSPQSPVSQEEAYKIWGIASRRMILQASGNITAFVKGAHPLSTFRQYELPTIMSNEKIKTINKQDKTSFFAEL